MNSGNEKPDFFPTILFGTYVHQNLKKPPLEIDYFCIVFFWVLSVKVTNSICFMVVIFVELSVFQHENDDCFDICYFFLKKAKDNSKVHVVKLQHFE